MTTTVVLIRHAEPEATFTQDFTRPLSEQGRRIQTKMSLHLKQQGLSPTHIFHSPFLRTTQTAEILGNTFEIKPELLDALGEPFDENTIFHILASTAKKTTFLVGHGPSLSHLANAMAGYPCIPGEIVRSGSCVLTFQDTIVRGGALFQNYYHPHEVA